jgi:cysteine desulfurase
MAVYFDHNATTPLCPAAREAWLAASDARWQNPSSLYRAAGEAHIALNDAREALADLLDCEGSEIVFNSGATEGNHSLMAWAAERWPEGRVAISGVEHPSVREPARRCFPGDRCLGLPVDGDGTVRLEALEAILAEGEVRLVSVMAACNETGVLQPWREIGALCRAHGSLFHSDATQWIGKMPLDGLAEACDYVTGSAHKFGGPKGCGFLKLASEDDAYAGQNGGPQEFGRRAGTQNVPSVQAMLAALAWAEGERPHCAGNMGMERDRFERVVCEKVPGTMIMGEGAPRLWNTSLLAMPDFEHVRWLTRLDRLGFQISTGSACSSGDAGPSHALQSMGVDFSVMKRVLRVSAGWRTIAEEWEALADAFATVFAELATPARSRAGHGIASDPRRL